jgi:para-aminobenzoate synthetase component 2
VLTDGGHRMLANWMAEAGHPAAPGVVAALTAEMAELAARADPSAPRDRRLVA